MSLEVCDLAGRMNAGVRASGALNWQPLPREILQNIAQRTLNRRLSRLHLPAAEIGSVVRQSQFNVLHGRREQLSHAPQKFRAQGVPAFQNSILRIAGMVPTGWLGQTGCLASWR